MKFSSHHPFGWMQNRLVALTAGGLVLGTVISCSDMVTDARATSTCSAGQEECSDALAQSSDVAIHRIMVLPWIDTIAPGESLRLEAVLTDREGNRLEGRAVTWSAGRHGVASVDSNGLVTGRAVGVETITASAENRKGYAAIHVRGSPAPGVARVTIDPASAALQLGGTTQFTATAFDADGGALSDRDFTWTSSNPGVAQVTASGLVTATGAGSATVTASTGGVSSTASVTVTAPAPTAARVTVSPGSANVQAGGTVQLTATAADANGNTIPGQTFTWSSSNTSVATVSSSGATRGVAAGSTTITARTGGVSGTASVTVTSPTPVVASVTITPASGNVQVGSTLQLAATARDANGNAIPGQTFTWSSSSASIATVSTSGLVRGASAGTATIRATTAGISASASVNVTAPASVVTRVTISPASTSVPVGGTTQLVATARDASGNPVPGQTFTWSSSNSSLATVSSTGQVTGRAAGITTITALTSGVSGTSSVTVQPASPPPSAEGVLFHSDWSTARGWSEEAYTDGGRWNFVSNNRGVPNKEIVAGAPLDFPTENVFRVHCTAEAECWSQLRVTTLPVPSVGERRFYRWYFRSTQPDNLEDGGTHPIESGGADNWAFEVYNTPLLGTPPGTYAAWFMAPAETNYSRMRWYLGSETSPIPLSKNVTYRFELQIHRIGSSTMNMHIRIYDTNDVLLYDDDDFRSPSGISLASNPTLALGNPSSLATLHVGNNGIGGSAPFPFTYAYEGAFCVRSDTWCGPYRDGI